MEFADVDGMSITIEPTWLTLGTNKESQYDLPPVKQEDKETQSAFLSEVECQTESFADMQALRDEGAEASAGTSNRFQGVPEFLSKVYPVMSDQLTRSAQSSAFDDYDKALDVDEQYSVSRSVSFSHESIDANNVASMQPCSDCSWNCTGSVLAVAYGRANHQGWCDHRGPMLCVWNVMRKRAVNTRADIEIEMASCLMCIEFHPELPTILAGGLFNGELRVWDTDSPNDEPLLMSSTVDDYFHREPISRVTWTRKLLSGRKGRGGDMKARLVDAYHLVSISGDGKVLFWTMENKLLHPTMGLLIIPSPKYFGHGTSMNKFPVLGGTAIDFSSKDASTFVVGTEIGGVLRSKHRADTYTAVMARATQVQGSMVVKDGEFTWSPEALSMVNNTDQAARFDIKRHIEKYAKLESLSVIQQEHIFASRPPPNKLFPEACGFAFEPHSGPVYAVAMSPFHRNIFLTCSTDGSVKLFNIHNQKPLLHLQPTSGYFFDVAWSPARPLVFAAADGDGTLYVYDLMSSMLNPVVTLQVPLAPPVPAGDLAPRSIIPSGVSSKELPRITGIAFNKLDPGVLATCGITGFTHIWNLSANLSSLQSGERELLEKMGSVAQDGDSLID